MSSHQVRLSNTLEGRGKEYQDEWKQNEDVDDLAGPLMYKFDLILVAALQFMLLFL